MRSSYRWERETMAAEEKLEEGRNRGKFQSGIGPITCSHMFGGCRSRRVYGLRVAYHSLILG